MATTTKLPRLRLIPKDKFDEMTRYQQRIAICKDVLLRLKLNLIDLNNGGACNLEMDPEIRPGNSKEMQSHLNDRSKMEQTECYVCAKGAMAMAWVGNFNHYTFRELNNLDVDLTARKRFPSGLKKVFGQQLLDALEIAYECVEFSWTHENVENYSWAIYETFGDGPEGFVKALENIIKNKGVLIFTCDADEITIGKIR